MLLLLIGRSHISERLLSGKVFEYLMVKKPILAYGPTKGAVAQLIQETNSGKMYDYENISDSRNFINEHYHRWQNNEEYVDFNNNIINGFERKNLTKKLIKIFEETNE